LANPVFSTPQISIPVAARFADCLPTVYTDDLTLARAYLTQNYIPRSAWKKWEKGPFPPPFLITSSTSGTTVSYNIFFNEFSGGSCPQFNCNILCTTQGIVLTQGGTTVNNTTFCIDGERPIYHFDVSFSTAGEITALPASFVFSFTDQSTNVTTIEVQSIGNIIPTAPLAGAEIDQSGVVRIYVAPLFRTAVGEAKVTAEGLDQYIIERCDWPSQTNIKTFKGLLNVPGDTSLFTDTDVSAGHQVGYRIKFHNQFGETSQFSAWQVANA